MRKWIIEICTAVLIMTSILFTGCDNYAQNNKPSSNINKKPVVYASFYPMYEFARNIGKDKIDVRLIVPSGMEVHDWEPTPKLIGKMETADVFIYNGLGMEPWAKKILDTIDNNDLVVVEASKGIHPIESQENTHLGYRHSIEYDPHVWLSPLNAIKEAENIKDALVKVDDHNKDFYETNYKEYANRLLALDKNFRIELSKVRRKEIVTAHAAFGYLASSYGLQQISITGISPEEEPSAAKMAQIAKFTKEHEVKYIFFETLTSPKLSEVLSQEVGAKTAVLNPIEGITNEDVKAGKNYISIMEDNLQILMKALGE